VELRDDQSHPWVARCIVQPDDLERPDPPPLPFREAPGQLRPAGETPRPRQPLAGRQRPPCLEPSRTVSRFRPFLRRRDRVARPQRVAIRARNPCVAARRLLRGR
jgi:hypothetical protein